jgi:hypothetical protein
MSLTNTIILLPKKNLVIDSSLLIYFDCYNYFTYPSVGLTTIKNLYGSIDGSLINSPTFSSSSAGGIFTFNGTSQYINFGNTLPLRITVGTISCWFRATSGNSSFRGIITKQNAWGLFLIDNVLSAFDWGNYYASGFDINQGIRSTGINLGTNTWTNVTMTFSETVGIPTPGPPNNNVIIYINGSPVLTTTTLHRDHSAPIQFAYANFSPQFLAGSMAQGMVYNRVLTPSEITQNFEATRSRFNI